MLIIVNTNYFSRKKIFLVMIACKSLIGSKPSGLNTKEMGCDNKLYENIIYKETH